MLRNTLWRTPRIRAPIDGSLPKVQQVKFYQKPLTRPANLIVSFVITYVLFKAISNSFDSSDLTKVDGSGGSKTYGLGRLSASKEEDYSENWKKQHAELQKASRELGKSGPFRPDQTSQDKIYITLPVWIRAAGDKLYEPSDPEWKEFVKLQGDAQKVKKLKEIVGSNVARAMKTPVHAVNLRHIGSRGQMMMHLDLVPQLYAPPHYEMPALCLERDGVSIRWRKLSPQLGGRMNDILRPIPTIQATWASLRVFFVISYRSLRNELSKALGKEGTPFELPSAGIGQVAKTPKQTPSQDGTTASEKSNSIQDLWADFHKSSAKELNASIVNNLPFSDAVAWSAAIFRYKQLMGAAQQKQRNTRGVVQIRGKAFLPGDFGRYQISVIAFYDPASDSFLGPITVWDAYVSYDFNVAQKVLDQRGRNIEAAKQGKNGVQNSGAGGSSDVGDSGKKTST